MSRTWSGCCWRCFPYTHTELPLFFSFSFLPFSSSKERDTKWHRIHAWAREFYFSIYRAKRYQWNLEKHDCRKTSIVLMELSKSPSNKHAGYIKIMGRWASLWKNIFYLTVPLELKLRLYTNCICEFKRTRYLKQRIVPPMFLGLTSSCWCFAGVFLLPLEKDK